MSGFYNGSGDSYGSGGGGWAGPAGGPSQQGGQQGGPQGGPGGYYYDQAPPAQQQHYYPPQGGPQSHHPYDDRAPYYYPPQQPQGYGSAPYHHHHQQHPPPQQSHHHHSQPYYEPRDDRSQQQFGYRTQQGRGSRDYRDNFRDQPNSYAPQHFRPRDSRDSRPPYQSSYRSSRPRSRSPPSHGYNSRPGGGGGSGGGGGGGDRYQQPRRAPAAKPNADGRSTENSTTLFVGNMPYRFQQADVEDLFKEFGPVANVSVKIDPSTGHNKGYCFVKFENRADAEAAYRRFKADPVNGRMLRIDWDVGFEQKPHLAATQKARRSSRDRSRSPSASTGHRSPRSGDGADHSSNLESRRNEDENASVDHGEHLRHDDTGAQSSEVERHHHHHHPHQQQQPQQEHQYREAEPQISGDVGYAAAPLSTAAVVAEAVAGTHAAADEDDAINAAFAAGDDDL